MPWPPTPGAGFIEQTGGPVIRWGTDGINPFASTVAIVVSCSPNDEIENLYVENGTGLKTVRIQLWQGRRINVTIVDDSSITPPAPGQTVTISDPLSGATFVNSFRVVENNYNAARKEPGQRVLVLEFLTNIEGGGATPAA